MQRTSQYTLKQNSPSKGSGCIVCAPPSPNYFSLVVAVIFDLTILLALSVVYISYNALPTAYCTHVYWLTTPMESLLVNDTVDNYKYKKGYRCLF